MKTSLFLLLLLGHFYSSAQNEELNQLNDKGKKHGVWKVYLDSMLNPVPKIDNAFFIAYESYENGDRIFKHFKNHNSDADSISYNMPWPKKGKPTILNGVFEWYVKNGHIIEHEEYNGGWPLYWKSYQYDSKNVCGFNEILDWSKKYNNIQGTYYYEELWYNKVESKGWFRNGKRGWRVYED